MGFKEYYYTFKEEYQKIVEAETPVFDDNIKINKDFVGGEQEDYSGEDEEDNSVHPDSVIAFPTKISGYTKDFLVVFIDGNFDIYNKEGDLFEIDSSNSLYDIYINFFNKHKDVISYDEYKEEYGDEHKTHYDKSDWDSDFVLVTDDKSLEKYLP